MRAAAGKRTIVADAPGAARWLPGPGPAPDP